MAVFSRSPREHWFKPHFSKNKVAKSGYTIFAALLQRNLPNSYGQRIKSRFFPFGAPESRVCHLGVGFSE
jgi:hypothetical protein